MNTDICEKLGIEVPVFAFTHCRDVVVEVSKAGGMGVLGAVGFTAEQFPRGGAMTLNTVSAMGLLTVGIFGFPFLGAVQDNFNAKVLMDAQPVLVEQVRTEQRGYSSTGNPDNASQLTPIVQEKHLFGVTYDAINAQALMSQPEFDKTQTPAINEQLATTGRKTLQVAAILPVVMAFIFILFILWFRSQGGYKPADINAAS